MLPPQLSAESRKELIKELTTLKKKLKTIKSKKAIDLELYKEIEDEIKFVRETLNFKQ